MPRQQRNRHSLQHQLADLANTSIHVSRSYSSPFPGSRSDVSLSDPSADLTPSVTQSSLGSSIAASGSQDLSSLRSSITATPPTSCDHLTELCQDSPTTPLVPRPYKPRLVVDTQAAGAEFGHQRQSKRASTFSALSEEEDDETPLALLIDIAQEIIVHPNGRFQASTARASIVNEPGQAIEFLIWTPLQSHMPVEADIVYVDPSYDTTDVPPLAESFLQQGFRIILPLFSSVQVKPGSVLTVERMVHCVGSVLIEVRRRDALLKYSSPPRNNQNMPSPAPSVVSPVESPTGRSRPEPLRRSTTDNKPVKPALKHKAIYILGIGLGGLVAAHYACHVSPYSTTTSSAQFTRLQRLQAKVINTASCFTGPDLESSAPTPYPTFRALILLSPSLEYQSPTTRATLSVMNFANGMQDEASGCLPRLRMRQPASDAREAARRLKAKTGLIRQPTLILHGDKDPITSQKAVNFFYDHLGSRDKCLAIYPALAQVSAKDSTFREDATVEILKWLKDRQGSPPSPGKGGKVQFARESQLITTLLEPQDSKENGAQTPSSALHTVANVCIDAPRKPSLLPHITVSALTLEKDWDENWSTYSNPQ